MQDQFLWLQKERISDSLIWSILGGLESLIRHLHLTAIVILVTNFISRWNCRIVNGVTSRLNSDSFVRSHGNRNLFNVSLRIGEAGRHLAERLNASDFYIGKWFADLKKLPYLQNIIITTKLALLTWTNLLNAKDTFKHFTIHGCQQWQNF